jgi:hypothetical protein
MKNLNLSESAQKLYSYLLQTGGAHEEKCMAALFPKPEYPDAGGTAEQYLAYWQWDANLYGNDQQRPVCGINTHIKASADYASVISKAYQELKKAGLADETNNGYNCYWFYPVVKK